MTVEYGSVFADSVFAYHAASAYAYAASHEAFEAGFQWYVLFFCEVEDFANHALWAARVDHVKFRFALFSQKLLEGLGGKAFESIGAVFRCGRGWFGAKGFELVEEE